MAPLLHLQDEMWACHIYYSKIFKENIFCAYLHVKYLSQEILVVISLAYV